MDYSMNFGETFVSLPKYMLEKDNIETVADILIDGGIICYPTDSVWGIGCDATNIQAINKLNKLKGIPNGVNGFPLEIIVDSIDMLKKYVDLHPRIETLLLFHKRPLTIVYPNVKNLPEGLYDSTQGVAFQVTHLPSLKKVIKAIDAPLIFTTANLFTQPYPKIFGEISSEIIEKVDYIYKEYRWDKASSQPATMGIVDDDGQIEFIRE